MCGRDGARRHDVRRRVARYHQWWTRLALATEVLGRSEFTGLREPTSISGPHVTAAGIADRPYLGIDADRHDYIDLVLGIRIHLVETFVLSLGVFEALTDQGGPTGQLESGGVDRRHVLGHARRSIPRLADGRLDQWRRGRNARRMSLRVRPATHDDADAIARLARGLNEFHKDPLEHFTPEAVLRDGFGASPPFAVLVAEHAGAVVGYALYHDAYEPVYAARGLYLSDLFVESGARRLGTGRALVAGVAGEARRRGATFVGWVSRAWNAEAQAFYRTLGAIEEPVVAHAVAFDAFTALADEGDALLAPSGGRR